MTHYLSDQMNELLSVLSLSFCSFLHLDGTFGVSLITLCTHLLMGSHQAMTATKSGGIVAVQKKKLGLSQYEQDVPNS